jgi:hypothetical protein
LAQARNPYSLRWLWIPDSLASLAPRNDSDIFSAPPSLQRHRFALIYPT